jgi:hypothetical protein
MKKRVFIILAAMLLFFLMSLSIQAYERPPGYENLQVDDQYEDYAWGESDAIIIIDDPGDVVSHSLEYTHGSNLSVVEKILGTFGQFWLTKIFGINNRDISIDASYTDTKTESYRTTSE